MVGQASAEKKNPHLNDKPDIIMIKHILLLAAAIGFTAQSSIFAADPTPAPSPAKAAVTETASPNLIFEIKPYRTSNENPNL